MFSDIDPILFSFRVKFYPADPFRLTGSGRLMLYQQLKRDLRHGRLYCSMGEAAALGALIVQGFTILIFNKKKKTIILNNLKIIYFFRGTW